MRRVSSGYTILEVAIVLAVSLGIMAAAWNLIGGKQAETSFNQKMRDTQSKLQDWINDVSTGSTGGDPSTQNCTVSSGGRPQLNSGGSSSAPNCIFLGKAIQFTDQNSSPQDEQLYAYTVFGCRIKRCAATGPNPTNLFDSNPKAADGLFSLDLTETFSLAPVHVKSVSDHLIGFFNSLDTSIPTSSNGAEDVAVYQFNLGVNDTTNGPSVDSCLQLKSPCGIPTPLTSPTVFTACLTDGTRYAEITISSQNGIGAQTDLVYKSC